MWHTAYSFQQHPNWGLHARPLEQEAADLLASTSLAACLSTLEIIRVTGADALTFLQGQTTCDFREVSEGHPRLGAHCNAKGRVQASFRAFHQDGDFLLLVPKGQGEPTRAALAKFALFSKATLSLDTTLAPLALLGPQAADWAKALFGATPTPGDCAANENGLITTLETDRLLALVPSGRCESVIKRLQALNATLAGDNVWWLAEIRAGIAQIPVEQNEQWIPQEINYDLVDGVNFKKGCYKGQEIVARIHYRGQTKVRAFPVNIEPVQIEPAQIDPAQSSTGIIPGTRIVDAAGHNIGTLLNIAYVNGTTLRGMAVLKTDASESETLRLEPNDGCHVRPLPLPYAINN